MTTLNHYHSLAVLWLQNGSTRNIEATPYIYVFQCTVIAGNRYCTSSNSSLWSIPLMSTVYISWERSCTLWHEYSWVFKNQDICDNCDSKWRMWQCGVWTISWAVDQCWRSLVPARRGSDRRTNGFEVAMLPALLQSTQQPCTVTHEAWGDCMFLHYNVSVILCCQMKQTSQPPYVSEALQ